ncbi:isochorismatase family protein [Beggiatoa leptomitoformis]|uniref:Isochorismatase family protein n=2 Tax=Beggiatoa leptomitoformis TaxID=288004 RepID=A0A2N9YJ24_9GAMM|nr:isochorismatase family protein [Beggiatoa leptomitoformis]AUI70541.1 isochorismatase family protein [Beggiatoa leptomitoformis]
MLMRATQACLLIIDVQERLIHATVESEQVITTCQTLIKVANRLQVPVLMSEQYPKGLGVTVTALRELVPVNNVMEKVHFSCTESENCRQHIQSTHKQQFVLGGIESHVCVQQTALGLIDMGYDVFLVEEAVSSRKMNDKTLALARMREAGVSIVSQEMVMFEWLQRASTPEFKEISQQFIKK